MIREEFRSHRLSSAAPGRSMTRCPWVLAFISPTGRIVYTREWDVREGL